MTTSGSLGDVYFDVDDAKIRYQQLLKTFTDHFEGHEPNFIARSPGRMNIIGDHVDYSYFPCVPAAISNDVVMAVEVVEDPQDRGFGKIQLVNTESKFAPYEFDADPQVEIEGRTWANYFKCSWITSMRSKGITSKDAAKGMRIAITGNVPADSGLSSSAAFVVTGCMVVLRAHDPSYTIEKASLVQLSATCEQLVGVNSGGLDQAASVFGEKDHALLVKFKPTLAVEPLKFYQSNDPLVFLIANSLAVSAKLETAPVHYNLRVVEVTVAANVLARKLNVSIPKDGNLQRGTLYGVLTEKYGDITAENLREVLKSVEKHLKTAPYTKLEAAEALGITVDELETEYLSAFPVRFEGLKLYQRAKHVYEETQRVLSFVAGIRDNASPQVLGDLMNESQVSSEKLYENSHPDCEKLCSIARKAGSLGSRVTGAGWGGCTIHLVPRSRAEDVRKALKKEYYDIHHPDAAEDALVETRPSGGSGVFNNLTKLLA